MRVVREFPVVDADRSILDEGMDRRVVSDYGMVDVLDPVSDAWRRMPARHTDSGAGSAFELGGYDFCRSDALALRDALDLYLDATAGEA